MSVTEFVIAFIFMAVATTTILVVGTLGAAGLLHRPRQSHEAEERPADRSHPDHKTEDTRSRPKSLAEAAERNAEVVDALTPLGASLPYVSHPKRRAVVDPNGDHDGPPHGRAA